MTDYLTQALLAEDTELLARIAACAAGTDPTIEEPRAWAFERAWRFAVRAGWCCAVQDAGGSSRAITDTMIHAAVLDVLSIPEDPPASDPPASDPPTDPSPAE